MNLKEDFDSAFELINRAREGELAEMIRLFQKCEIY